MSKVPINPIASGYRSSNALNSVFADIEAGFDNTLSRDGTAPNFMLADLDMNSNRLINLAPPVNPNDAARLADLSGTSGGGGTIVGGAGLQRFTYEPTDQINSLLYRTDLNIGDTVRTAVYNNNRQYNSGATFLVVAGTPVTLGLWTYDDTNKRLLVDGVQHQFQLLPDAPLNMAQLGLLSNDTAGTVSQDNLWNIVRDYTISRFSSDIQEVVGPKVSADGIMYRANTDPTLDLKMMPFVAGSSFKFFAQSGFNGPRPIVRVGRGTSPQNRFTISTDVDVDVDGDQLSTLLNTTTRVVGVEVYDDTGASSPFRARAHRCYVGVRVRGNTEKKRLHIGGAYNTILCDYAPQRVSLSDYASKAGVSTVADLDQYLLLNDGSGSGYQGEWNATLNQQGIASGVGIKGATLKIATGGTSAVAIDGRTAWTAGKWLVFDGSKWYQINDTDDTPDSNEITLTGQNNETLFRTSYNADCSAIINLLHESRIYNGGTVQAYQGSLTESLIIPTPAILDQGGKWFKYVGHARGGDQLLFGFTGKDKGTDTTVFDLSDNHVYGTMWWFDDAAKIQGQQRWEDCANGRDPVHSITNSPVPVVRINKVADAGDFRLSITKAVNLGAGADGFQIAAVIVGDESRKKFSTNLNLPHVAVVMGNPSTIVTADPSPNTYYAIQVRMVNGLRIVSPELRGRLDYWKDAKKVHHTVPASYVRAKDTVTAAAGSTVTIEVAGDLTPTEAFGIAWPTNIVVICNISGQRHSRVNGKWRPAGQTLISATSRDASASNANRYYDTGTEVYIASTDQPYWLKSNLDWRNIAATTYTPALMSQTTALLATYTALGFGNPTGSDLNALDRAIYRMVDGGIWSKGRLLIPAWMGDSRLRSGVNVFQANVSDAAGHPYNITIPSANWTAYRGYLPGGATVRISTGLNVQSTPSGGWVPNEGLVSGGNFFASLFCSTYDHTVINAYDFIDNDAYAGVRNRSSSGAQARMNSTATMSFSLLASDSPHMLGVTRYSNTATDMYLTDNGTVDTQADSTYASSYTANKGLPTTFWLGGGNTGAGSTLVTSDRTIGHVSLFTPLTADETSLWADIEHEWGTSLGYYTT